MMDYKFSNIILNVLEETFGKSQAEIIWNGFLKELELNALMQYMNLPGAEERLEETWKEYQKFLDQLDNEML